MSVTKSCSAALTVGFALAPALSHGQSITQTPTTLYSLENNPANLADGAVPLTPALEHQSSVSTLSLFFGNVSTILALPFNGGVYSMPITGTAASTLSAGCSWGAGTPMGDDLEVPTSLGDVLVMAVGRVPNAGVNNNHNDPGDYGELIACNESSGGSSATVLYRFPSIGTGTAGGVPSGSMVGVFASGVSGSQRMAHNRSKRTMY